MRDIFLLVAATASMLLAGFALRPPVAGATHERHVDLTQELEQDLEMGLQSVELLVDEIPEELRKLTAARVGCPPSALADLQLYRGRGRGPASSAMEDLALGVVPLEEPLDGARLVFAVARSGRVAHAVIRGRPEFDQDPNLAWTLFLGQLCSYGSLGPADELVQDHHSGTSSAELDGYLKELDADTDDDSELLRALIRQRIFMRGFTLLQRELILQKDVLPPVEWIDAKRQEMARIGELSPLFAGFLGEEDAQRHSERATAAASYFEELGAAARAGDRATFTGLAARTRAICNSCHELPVEDSDLHWDGFFAQMRADLSLPRGVFRVGFDVAPALGDERGDSQRIADALRGGLLLVDALVE